MRALPLAGLLLLSWVFARPAGAQAASPAKQERSAQALRFSKHALARARERGISRKRIEALVASRPPFEYGYHGRREKGYFDPKSGLFAAVGEDGVVITVFSDATQAYVDGLKKEKP